MSCLPINLALKFHLTNKGMIDRNFLNTLPDRSNFGRVTNRTLVSAWDSQEYNGFRSNSILIPRLISASPARYIGEPSIPISVTNCVYLLYGKRNSLAPPAHPGVVLPGQVAGV